MQKSYSVEKEHVCDGGLQLGADNENIGRRLRDACMHTRVRCIKRIYIGKAEDAKNET